MVYKVELEQGDRILFKIGTGAIEQQMPTGGLGLNAFLVNSLAAGIANDFYDAGKGFLIYPYIVTSGAVYLGMVRMGLKERPQETEELQALASIGEPHLGHWYDEIFRNHGLGVNQGLLTQETLQLNGATRTIERVVEKIFQYGFVPRFNENDAVSNEELRQSSRKSYGEDYAFSDNDQLALLLAQQFNVNAIMFITDVDGLYDKDPKQYGDAKLMEMITEDSEPDTSQFAPCLGRGGMQSKWDCAIESARYGITAIIVNADKFTGKDSIKRVLNGDIQRTVVPAHFGRWRPCTAS